MVASLICVSYVNLCPEFSFFHIKIISYSINFGLCRPHEEVASIRYILWWLIALFLTVSHLNFFSWLLFDKCFVVVGGSWQYLRIQTNYIQETTSEFSFCPSKEAKNHILAAFAYFLLEGLLYYTRSITTTASVRLRHQVKTCHLPWRRSFLFSILQLLVTCKKKVIKLTVSSWYFLREF